MERTWVQRVVAERPGLEGQDRSRSLDVMEGRGGNWIGSCLYA